MDIVRKKIEELKPYENNPRNNEEAVGAVARSIKEFGFLVPVVIDKNNVIVAGHTRTEAAKKNGLEEVPCIVADDLTEEQVNAFRLADNKLAELSGWDYMLLEMELMELGIDLSGYGFELGDDYDIEDVFKDFEDKEQNKKVKEMTCPYCGATFEI